MTMQRGFGAGQEVQPEQNSGNPLHQGTSIFRISHKEGENRKTTCLLDDEPIWGYRHTIKRPYVPGAGDWRDRDIRVTCASSQSKQDDPRNCLICEAMLRNSDTIKRKFTANLTLIDEGEHMSKKTGKKYYDLKKRLELDWSYYKVFEEQKRAQPGGRLVGMRFSVLRPSGDPKQTKTFGNSWTPLGIVNLIQHFGQATHERSGPSNAIRGLLEQATRQGKNLSPQDALQMLVSPIDESELNNYSPEMAQRFIMYALAKSYTASGGGQQYGGQQPSMPGMGQSMPSNSVPDYSTGGQQQQQQPQQAMGMPMGQPGQGSVPPPPQQGQTQYSNPPGQQQQQQPMGAPAVANPMGSTMPQQSIAPPPQDTPPWDPQQGQQTQPMAPQQSQPQTQVVPGNGPLPGVQQVQQPQGQPQQPMAPAQPQQAQQAQPGYAYEQAPGWNSAFPGGQQQQQQQQPAQGQVPQQAPQQPVPAQGQPQPQPTPQPVPVPQDQGGRRPNMMDGFQ